MILSFQSQKGGVGKSTLARLMAVELARAGWSILLADLDARQGTACQWARLRAGAGHAPAIEARAFQSVAAAVHAAVHFDATILDGPAQANRESVAIARASALTVLPSGWGRDDLDPQARLAFELEEAEPLARVRLAFSHVRGSRSEGDGARTYLARAGLVPFAAELRELPTIRLALNAGLAPSETTHRKINAEARALAREIAEELTT